MNMLEIARAINGKCQGDYPDAPIEQKPATQATLFEMTARRQYA